MTLQTAFLSNISQNKTFSANIIRQYTLRKGYDIMATHIEALEQAENEIELLLNGKTLAQIKEVADKANDVSRILVGSPHAPSQWYHILAVLDIIVKAADKRLEDHGND